jgi:hypothetical protein
MMTGIVYVRDASSGRIHVRVRVAGVAELASFESCNADSAGAAEEITAEQLAEAEPDRLCGRCFAADEETP